MLKRHNVMLSGNDKNLDTRHFLIEIFLLINISQYRYTQMLSSKLGNDANVDQSCQKMQRKENKHESK